MARRIHSIAGGGATEPTPTALCFHGPVADDAAACNGQMFSGSKPKQSSHSSDGARRIRTADLLGAMHEGRLIEGLKRVRFAAFLCSCLEVAETSICTDMLRYEGSQALLARSA